MHLTGPYEVFVHAPGAQVHFIWKEIEPVISDHGLVILPTATLEHFPALDLICVLGESEQIDSMEDDAILYFLHQKANEVKLVTLVCTR
ncbi:MAG: hypothetical protein ACSLEN_09245 [Candidatus Malihini olakiniferum]